MRLPISDITVKQEQLNDAEIQSIAQSFNDQGQLHPVAVHRVNGQHALITGRKRLAAAVLLGWTELECLVYEGLSTDQQEEIVLHENLKRFDLPWFESVLLTERMHLLQQKLHGKPPEQGGGRVKTGWSVKDTAALLQQAVGKTSQDLQLARAVKQDPSLSRVKDKRTALRLVNITVKRMDDEELAGASDFNGLKMNQLFCADSAVALKHLPNETFHVCITDPPWLRFFDDSLRLDERTLPVFRELYRVMRYDSFLYMFAGMDDYHYYAGRTEPDPDNPSEVRKVSGELEKIGFRVAKTPLFWRKLKSLSRRGVTAWEHGRDFEFILLAVKGNPVLKGSVQDTSFFDFDAVPPVKLIHPNEKPVNLIKKLLEECSFEGNAVIDPFAGSFVVPDAAKQMKRPFIAIDRDQDSYSKGCKRLGIKEE
jgi:ParB-like chromosome segregation protein Spo0J/DNA modification methylase